MANFRQFKGVQEIEFAYGADGDGPNVTVIHGNIGRGKTGIFRAIMFCLFGERRLSQDGDVPDSELHLVNSTALEESEGKPVKSYVELEFSHRGSRYNLKRTLSGMFKDGQVLEELDDVQLVRITPDGNTEVERSDIERIIGSILDRRVKDYFLFDGERIERLTRASLEQRREIAKGIRNLLNIDALETAIKATSQLTRELEDELGKHASPELAKLLKRLKDNEEAQEDKRRRLEEIGDEATAAQKEKADVDRKLEEFREIRDLVERRKEFEDSLRGMEQQAREHLSNMKSLIVKAASLLVAPTVKKVFNHIERQKQKGEIPSEIRRDLIERILAEKRCICNREICEGTEAYTRILEWRDRTSDVTIQDAALNLWRYLSDVQGRFDDDASQVENRLLEYGNIRNEIEAARCNLESLRHEIGTSERQDATKLDEHRKKLEEKAVKLEAESQRLQADIADLEREHGQLIAQLNEEKLRQGRHDELSRRASLARDTRDALNAVYDEFTREIKTVIGRRATDLFRKLLDSEGRENLRTLVVNDDFSLQVLDRWNKPFLANISAGQRQLMSISFIAALAEAASKNGLLEMPLFMDTPFGRLSGEPRENLVRLMPRLTSQWILLATDTEFRKQEARLLREGGRWGKFYKLRMLEDGNTIIEEHNVETAQALLRDEGDSQ